MVISVLDKGLKSSNWAVRERMWIVAERRKGEVWVEGDGWVGGLGWIEGTGRVILRPDSAEDSAGFP